MARPEKTGLDYYTMKTDIFLNRKVRRLLKHFGAQGYLIYNYLLTEIYRDKGYFLSWDDDTAFDVSDTLNLKESLIGEVVGYCCNVGLFNKELRTSENILTTKNIQEFWINVSKQANRKCSEVEVRYSLIDVGGTPNEEESTLTRQESTPNGQETSLKGEESTQSKEKESKEKKRKLIKGVDLIFESEQFEKYWTQYKDHRKKNHKFRFVNSDSENRALKTLYNLVKGDEKLAIECLLQCIDKGWKGFYLPEKQKKQTNSRTMKKLEKYG
ncbi:DUF4373 domain-containing protein [Spongiimicrobium salis]|uniref:DUF4373 domain-containing protein n=1 Tax=Spongiimicrobium salis TaxID=1667022 RepID=UPI00374D6D55